MAPIKLQGRFATAYDTARTLGVSPSRTRQLIKQAHAVIDRMAHRSSETGLFTTEKKRKASTLRGNDRTHAKRKATSRRVKSGR